MADVTGTSAAKRRAAKPGMYVPQQATTPLVQSQLDPQVLNPDQTPGAPAASQAVRQAKPTVASAWVNPYPTQYAHQQIVPPPELLTQEIAPGETVGKWLSADDIAGRISEFAKWDSYFSGLETNAANLSIETGTKVADIERALADSLENTNWNMASRGLGASSIKDTSKVNQATRAGANISELTGKLGNVVGQLGTEKNTWETSTKPGLEAAVVGKAGENFKNRPVAPTAPPEEIPQAEGAAAPTVPQLGTPYGADPHIQSINGSVRYVDENGGWHILKVTNSGTYIWSAVGLDGNGAWVRYT